MDAAYVANLERALSKPRLDRFRPPSGGDLETAANYLWNVALSEALYPSLALLEVTLRNSIHDTLTAFYQTDRWFYEPGLLEPQQLREFATARLNLYRAHGNLPTAGRIVAELTFGFWTTILSQPYHQTLWAPNHAALLKAVFPHMPPTPNARRHAQSRYNGLRLLRNRVSHHEPIWTRPTLVQDHADIHTAIGWISPEAADGARLLDRFPQVYQTGKDQIEQRLKQLVGIS